jgi:pimeloyl-ACP methyl ester carboxylesterase
MRGTGWLAVASGLALAALAHAAHSGGAETPPTAPTATASAVPPSAPSAASPSAPNGDAAAPSASSLPTHIPVTPPDYEVLDAGTDRPIRILPSAQPGRRVLVYLHGYCGDVNAVGAFVPAAAAHGTLIALLGDQPCKDKPGRFKWSTDAHAQDQRIQRAIRLVNQTHGWDLDANDVTLFGYSQGAVRAEALVRYYAKRYPRVILGGPPRRLKVEHFKHVQAVAVFGGELENTTNMAGGADDLIVAGFRARFFLFPGVDHGDFGGELAGNLALSEILEFVSAPNQPEPSAPEAPEKIAR